MADLGVFDVLGFGIEGGQGPDARQEHPHGVGVIVEAIHEPLAEVLVDIGVVPDLVRPALELVNGRQLPMDEQVRHLQVRGLRRDLLDRVTPVAQDAGVAVEVGDGARRHRRRHERGVVEPDPREQLAQLISRDTAVDDRDLDDLAAAIVGHRDRFSHLLPL